MISLMMSEEAVASLRVTVTGIVHFTLLPSVLCAVMLAVPSPAEVTSPLASTIATLVSLLLQVRDGMVALAGNTVAESCLLSPSIILSEVADGVIEVTGTSSAYTSSLKLVKIHQLLLL